MSSTRQIPQKYQQIMSMVYKALKTDNHSELKVIPLEDLENTQHYYARDEGTPGYSLLLGIIEKRKKQENGTVKSVYTKMELCLFSDNKKCSLEKSKKEKPFCFIALPTSLANTLAMNYIEEVLSNLNITYYKAVENVSPAKEMWCEKIFSKILEADFCIVFLNEEKRKANPNVYYEYGFMSGINKKIIPIQNSRQKLQFDVMGKDTLKYKTGKDLQKKLKIFIKHVLS